jgi:hypothetical protein
VLLRDIQFDGPIRREASGGELFLEDVCCGTFELAGNKPVWARQLNTEGDGVRIVNRGAPLWILGIKTEGANTAISSFAASRTEVLGGLLYPVRPVPPDLPAFHVKDSSFTATVAESSYAAAAAYSVLLRGCSATGAVVERMDTRPPPDRLGRFVLSLTYPSSGARKSIQTSGGC